ncbi:PH domain-containing protein [Rhodococcus chondri]|uniref:PH domain-containing protein n=1 Tax=Rhodococcus chondri TaxID=3065941 RepID=A0ABU7JR91_9NOCA|nr:PH domain-containing protein [Rhodococcus sp. CC-R104]MEE2032257.1 PH domain-containing protein [Rhodococcus sp. CC-R104]
MSTGTGLQWSTRPAAVAALAVGGAVLAVAATVVATDPAGRFLVGFAAVLALATAALALRQRPRLAVLPDATGIAVTRLTGRREYSRPELHRVRLVDYPRLGRRVPMLEIDIRDPHSGTEQLMIFGRWDLGADPRDVYDALAARGLAPDQTPS